MLRKKTMKRTRWSRAIIRSVMKPVLLWLLVVLPLSGRACDMAVISDSNVNLATNIRDVLNAEGGSVTNDTLTFFQERAKINMWSKHKPVPFNSDFIISEENKKSIKYGISNIPYFDSYLDMVQFFRNGTPLPANCTAPYYKYTLPEGGISEPLRIGDFRKYKSDCIPPVAVVTNSTMTNGHYGGYEIVGAVNARILEIEINKIASDDEYNVSNSDLIGINTNTEVFALNEDKVEIKFDQITYQLSGVNRYRTAYKIMSTGSLYSDYTDADLVGNMYIYPYLKHPSTGKYYPLVFANKTIEVLPYVVPVEFTGIRAEKIINPSDENKCTLLILCTIANRTNNDISTEEFTVQGIQQFPGDSSADPVTIVSGSYTQILVANSTRTYSISLVVNRTKLNQINYVRVDMYASGIHDSIGTSDFS